MRVTLLLLLLLPAVSAAQVYKCTGRSGETVYSQDPCHADAQPHVLRSGQPAGSEGMRVDSGCLAQARARIYANANDRAAGINQRIAELRSGGAPAADLARLERERSQAYTEANTQLNAARRQCLRARDPEAVPQQDAAPLPHGGQADS